MPRRHHSTLAAFAAAITLALAACGGGSEPTLSAEAEAGRALMRSKGCASCHGANGQGGVGPSFEGLWGQPVALEDGSTVTADEAYLRRSIREPQAQIVQGYRLPMPTNDLTDAEIDQVLHYIEALAPEAGE